MTDIEKLEAKIARLRERISDQDDAIRFGEESCARLHRRRDEARRERDEARRERDEARRELGEILAVIHRDGGHYTGEHGISKSVADAHATWAAMVRERDDARDELAKTSADFHDVWESRDKVIEERERARQACNAYWHDLSRIAGLCEQADDEYPLKAVERTVREFAQARAEVERRDREHEALVETAQEALARVTDERDEARSDVEYLRSAYKRYGAAGVSEALKEISHRDGHPSDSTR